MKKCKIIDISKWNAIVDYSAIKNSVDGAIVRAGFRSNNTAVLTMDSRFLPYMIELDKNKLPLGAYFVTSAITEDEAKEEADFFIDCIKNSNVSLRLPIYVCSEWTMSTHNGRSDNLPRVTRTSIIKAFISRCSELGYDCGLMCKGNWLSNQLNAEELDDVNKWMVYDTNDNKSFNNVNMVRIENKATIKGIAGFVSLNEMSIEIESCEEKIVEETKTNDYSKGSIINVEATGIYKTYNSKEPIGVCYGEHIVMSEHIRNNRVKIGNTVTNKAIGWINIQ